MSGLEELFPTLKGVGGGLVAALALAFGMNRRLGKAEDDIEKCVTEKVCDARLEQLKIMQDTLDRIEGRMDKHFNNK